MQEYLKLDSLPVNNTVLLETWCISEESEHVVILVIFSHKIVFSAHTSLLNEFKVYD